MTTNELFINNRLFWTSSDMRGKRARTPSLRPRAMRKRAPAVRRGFEKLFVLCQQIVLLGREVHQYIKYIIYYRPQSFYCNVWMNGIAVAERTLCGYVYRWPTRRGPPSPNCNTTFSFQSNDTLYFYKFTLYSHSIISKRHRHIVPSCCQVDRVKNKARCPIVPLKT